MARKGRGGSTPLSRTYDQQRDRSVIVEPSCDEDCAALVKAKPASGAGLRLAKATAQIVADEAERLWLRASAKVERGPELWESP